MADQRMGLKKVVSIIDAHKTEGQEFSHMPDHETCLWETIKHAGEDDPQRVCTSFECPSEGRPLEGVPGAAGKGGGWVDRVDVDGNLECCTYFPQVPELLIIKVHAIGVAVDERSAQAKLFHGVLQLRNRRGRILAREGGEGGEARRVFAHHLCHEVIGLLCVREYR